MAPILCWCKVMSPNTRFGIRLFQFDSTPFKLNHAENIFNHNSTCNINTVRHQGTKADASRPGKHANHRTKKKKLVDIIGEKNDSLSESKVKITRVTQHSFDQTMSRFFSASAPLPKDTCHNDRLPSGTSNAPEHLEEVSFNKFNNILREHIRRELPGIRDDSELVRWNRWQMHTYDATFFMSESERMGSADISNYHNNELSSPFTGFAHVSNVNPIINRKPSEVENSNGIENTLRNTPIDLALLSSPLTDFDKVGEFESVVDRKVANAKTKTKVTSKKVVSTKKKTAKKNVKGKKETKQVSQNMQQAVELEEICQEKGIENHLENTPVDLSLSSIPFINVDQIVEPESVVERKATDTNTKKELKSNKKVISTKKKKKTKQESKKMQQDQQLREIRHQAREVVFNQTLEAYLAVCISVGLISHAVQTLLYSHRNGINRPSTESRMTIKSIRPYNIVLEGLAEKGRYKKMKELAALLKKSSITMNAQSFAPLFNYLGSQPASSSNTRHIKDILQAMEKAGVEIDMLFTDVVYKKDGYDNVLRAVHRLLPEYKPIEKQDCYEYDCSLLNSLNDSLKACKVRPPLSGLATEQDLDKWIEEQLSVELVGEVSIASIERKKETYDVLMCREELAKWESNWRDALYLNFTSSLDTLKEELSSKQGRDMSLYPYLACLPPEDYVNIMMQEINELASGSEHHSPSRRALHSRIGEKVYRKFIIHHNGNVGNLDRWKIIYKKFGLLNLSNHVRDGLPYIPRIQWKQLMQEEAACSLESTITVWPYNILLSVGRFLYSLLLKHVVVWHPLHTVEKKSKFPAFYEINRSKGYKLTSEIKTAPILLDLYRQAAKPTLTFPSYTAPMMSPPVPWTSPNSGGYVTNSKNIVRLPYSAYRQRQLMEEFGERKMFPVMDSLNQLGSIPWRINQPMLDLIIEIFNNKGWEELDIPPPVSECQAPAKIQGHMSNLEKKQIQKEQISYHNKKGEMHSRWCDALYKLSFANHFRDRIIWFPHNMDFRGRVYPLNPYLNHMSSDIYRALLYFARGEKLGSRGLWWLKLHVINLTGHLKRESIDSRIKYCDTVLDEIIDSAENPMTGRKWWTTSDEPWQTLAACKELKAALECDNPEEYVCHLPIHQDGSCNGLQHYAALGRDLAGAVSVNLCPSVVPQDVYSAVCELVENARLKDASDGNEVAQMLDGFVKRKTIKQTVMTTVYGVTKYGGRLQIERQLKDLNFPQQKINAGSSYLVEKTFLSLGQMFVSAQEIQDWFTCLALLISKTCKQNMEWVTPLGFPVVQHYTIPTKHKCPALKSDLPLNVDYIMQPNAMKQKNAFPPNFIHSLDSSHMMLTSLHSQKADFTFAAIHDCFWTHACNVDSMSKICREQFVALHSEPILEDLADYLYTKFSFKSKDFFHDGSESDMAKTNLNKLLVTIPKKGKFDIEEVLKSIYFFS